MANRLHVGMANKQVMYAWHSDNTRTGGTHTTHGHTTHETTDKAQITHGWTMHRKQIDGQRTDNIRWTVHR